MGRLHHRVEIIKYMTQQQKSKEKEKMKMFEEMKELIAEGLNIDESRITESASFKDDLGADSLDLFELVMSLEDKYDVEIPSEELEKLLTVGDVIKYIEEHK